MKKSIALLFFISFIFLLAISFSHAKDNDLGKDIFESGQSLYTAYNIWIWPSHNMKCINYKGGRIKINAGTEIEDVKLLNLEPNNNHLNFEPNNHHQDIKKIAFKIVESGKKYKIRFINRYHKGKAIEDYMEYMFTTNSLDEQIAGMNSIEKSAIRKGIVVDGMSKKAVLASYGHPPEHVTRSLEKNKWKYWISKRKTELVHFNSNGRTYNTEFLTE